MDEKIRALVLSEFGLEDATANDTVLFSTGLLDSLSAVHLLTLLEDRLGVILSPLDVSLDDVDSIDAITATVARFS